MNFMLHKDVRKYTDRNFIECLNKRERREERQRTFLKKEFKLFTNFI